MTCKLDIREFDPDGSNEKIIADDAWSMKISGDELYYIALEYINGSLLNMESKVRSYNINTGEYKDFMNYVDYMESPNYAIMSKDELEKYIEYYKSTDNDISVVLNGTELAFDQPPVLKDGRMITPLRAIFEAMGASVDWDGDTRTVYIDN